MGRAFTFAPFRNNMNTVLMHGPGIANPSIIVERDVPECDIDAYKAAGYKMGANPDKEFATIGVTYSEEDAAAQVADVPSTPKRKRNK